MNLLRNLDVKDKKVLVRCDFNVPLDNEGNILDDFRIRKAIPTIKFLVENGARTVLMSHLGDPGGKFSKNLTMDKVYEKLKELLDATIYKTQDSIGKEVQNLILKMKSGEIILLGNLRFNPGEEENDPEFAKELAKLGNVYVNEAFSACHRDHASVSGVPRLLPAFAGFLLEKELNVLKKLIENPEKPLTVIIGGTKVETKSRVIEKFLGIADFVLVSGLIKKEIDEKNIKFKNSEKIIFPTGDLGAKDINQKTVEIFREKISISKTVFWNGPMGKFEEKEFENGTRAIAEAIAQSPVFSVVGGGETVEFINKLGLIDKFSHVSTGGGALLAFLSGEKLPGLEAL